MRAQKVSFQRRKHLLVFPVLVMSALILLVGLAVRGVEKDSRRLIVGGDDNYPPYEFLDSEGRPAGFDVDLMRAVGEVMRLEMDIRLGPWNEVRGELEAGRIDAVTGMFRSEERDRLVDFSTPHTVASYTIFVRRGSPIRSMEDVRGKEILVQEGDIMHDYAVENGLSDRIIAVENQADALRLLASGRHDCAILAKIQGLYNADKSKLTNIETVGPPILPREFCFAVTEGNSDLLAKLNEGLRILHETGRYDEIHDKWFGAYGEGAFARKIFKYALWILTPLVFLLVGMFLWSRSLKRRVDVRTKELNRELTERKQAEEAIRRLAEIARNASDGVILTDPEGRALYVNPAFEKMSGYTQGELMNRDPADLIADDDAAAVGEEIRSAVREKGEWTGELLCRRKSGEVYPVESRVFAIRNREGDLVEIGAIQQDISERKRAEEVLIRYALVCRSMEEALMICTCEGVVIDMNPAAEKTFGWTREELVGKTAETINPPEEAKKIIADINRTLRQKGVWRGEIPLVTKSGERRTLSTVISCLRDKSGKWIGNIGINRDITERKRLEEQLRHAQKMEALGTLAGGIAHDFNNILAGIMGYAAITRRRFPEEFQVTEDMEAIERLSWRGADLTKALLAFARKGKCRPKVLKISSIINDVLKVIEETAGKGIYIKKDLSRAVSNVFGDEGQLHQVVMNLCINACEAMHGGGTLTVETGVAGIDDRFLALYPRLKKGNYVSVRFSDTGVGMDEETREHIFEPFFTTKAEKSGTGLGLSMVIGIVEGHGGWIEVESEPGKGSVFTVYLPGTEEAIEETQAKAAGAMRGGETILLVDDEADFRYGTGRWLEELGYKVIEAASGDEALEVLGGKRDEIDLVLLDMIMKGISGVETFQRMREIVPGLPIIICSGYSVDAATRQLLKKGACDFLQKPFDSNGLALKIRDVLDGC